MVSKPNARLSSGPSRGSSCDSRAQRNAIFRRPNSVARYPNVAARLRLYRRVRDEGTTKPESLVDTGKTCDVHTTTAFARCDLTAPVAGEFWLLATAQDTRGRTINAATSVFVASGTPPVAKPK